MNPRKDKGKKIQIRAKINEIENKQLRRPTKAKDQEKKGKMVQMNHSGKEKKDVTIDII